MRILRFAVFHTIAVLSWAQSPDGRTAFQSLCSGCHGADGNGGEHAPSIVASLAVRSEAQLAAIVRDGLPLKGMPAFKQLNDAQMTALITHIRGLQPRRGRRPAARQRVQLTDGTQIEGLALGRTGRELQLRTDDQKIHLLRKSGEQYRSVTTQADWPSMHGDVSGNRYSAMKQITPANVGRMMPKWVFAVPNAGRLQGTPQVHDGVMYVTNTNTVSRSMPDRGAALAVHAARDPGSRGQRPLPGKQSQRLGRRRPRLHADRQRAPDRPEPVHRRRSSGTPRWPTTARTTMPPDRCSQSRTSSSPAPRAAKKGVRGFLAAYDQATGKEVWRIWTIPAKGEPGSETWDGIDIDHGGGPTWLTGSYDPDTKTVYWPTGNAGPDFNGDNRKGDNLYTCSILALDVIPAS